MKKSLLALATLGLFAGAASAQSSVTLFGIVDAAYGHVSANGKSVSGISNSGINSSRLGFRGVEDIGGGLKAGFWLEAAVNNDVGTVGGGNYLNGNTAAPGLAAAPAAFFNRRSTVSLMGGFGEIRLGRDFTPTFWNTTVYDPFGTNGVGQALTPGMLNSAGLAPSTYTALTTAGGNGNHAVRANNTIAYFLPGDIGGVTGQFQYGFGENGAAASGTKMNNYYGFRVGYAAGPVSAHIANGKSTGLTSSADVKYTNIGASFDAGVVKPMIFWGTEKTGAGAKVTGLEVGLVAPVGAGEIHAAYSKYDVAASSNDWHKLALGYVHNVSKRTALYGTYAKVGNKGVSNVSVANNGLSAGSAAAGGSSTGYEFGLRHSF